MTQDVGWAERSEPHQNAEKVALVTGGGKRRVGNVIAQALAARGFAVALHYNRSAEEARQSLLGLLRRGRPRGGVSGRRLRRGVRRENVSKRL